MTSICLIQKLIYGRSCQKLEKSSKTVVPTAYLTLPLYASLNSTTIICISGEVKLMLQAWTCTVMICVNNLGRNWKP